MDDLGFEDALAGIEAELRWDQLAVAGTVADAARRAATFAERIRSVPTGEVVALSCLDGTTVRGRLLGVGIDVVTLGEVLDPEGTARLRHVRIHEVRMAAVGRLVREGL